MLESLVRGGFVMSVRAKRRVFAASLCVAALFASAQLASAQEIVRGSATDLVTFDRWCAEVVSFPESRCESRRPDDYAEFRVYRDKVERFEADFMFKKEKDRVLLERVETQTDIYPIHNLDDNSAGRPY
jgi:hypothetical protein